MKFLILIPALLLSSLLVHSQTAKPGPDRVIASPHEYVKECGDPVTESSFYRSGGGKVTRILDARSIVLETKRGKTTTVYLAGIDPKVNQDNIIKFLSATILGKTVFTFGNKEKESDGSLFAIVHGRDEEGRYFVINRHLLEKGLAEFAKPDYFYGVSYVTMCVYRQLVEKAKKEKIGIWAK